MYGDCQHEWPITLDEAMDDTNRDEQLETECRLCHVTLRQAMIDVFVEQILTQ